MTTEKVIIIGGGPTGLSAAIYNARAELTPLVIAGSPPGGQLILTSDVENYPGFPSIKGPDLIAAMRRHAAKFGVRFIDENVSRVDLAQTPLTVALADGKTSHSAETILIASGADALWLNLPSEQRLRGHGVSACAVCDGFFFKDKIVGVIGGGDTAMEEALTLTKFAQKVYIIHRRDQFRASKIMQKRVFDHPKIEIIWNAQIEEVLGENKVEGIRLKSTDKPIQPIITNSTIKLDGLFIAIGHKPATDFLKDSGVLLDEKGYVVTSSAIALENIKIQKSNLKNTRFAKASARRADQNSKIKSQILDHLNKFNFNYQYATSVRGVFAAGDVIDPHYRQAATAAGMGVAAALEMESYLNR